MGESLPVLFVWRGHFLPALYSLGWGHSGRWSTQRAFPLCGAVTRLGDRRSGVLTWVLNPQIPHLQSAYRFFLRRHLEHRPVTVGAARVGCAVKVPHGV